VLFFRVLAIERRNPAAAQATDFALVQLPGPAAAPRAAAAPADSLPPGALAGVHPGGRLGAGNLRGWPAPPGQRPPAPPAPAAAPTAAACDGWPGGNEAAPTAEREHPKPSAPIHWHKARPPLPIHCSHCSALRRRRHASMGEGLPWRRRLRARTCLRHRRGGREGQGRREEAPARASPSFTRSERAVCAHANVWTGCWERSCASRLITRVVRSQSRGRLCFYCRLLRLRGLKGPRCLGSRRRGPTSPFAHSLWQNLVTRPCGLSTKHTPGKATAN
jgi:hypothetical protein